MPRLFSLPMLLAAALALSGCGGATSGPAAGGDGGFGGAGLLPGPPTRPPDPDDNPDAAHIPPAAPVAYSFNGIVNPFHDPDSPPVDRARFISADAEAFASYLATIPTPDNGTVTLYRMAGDPDPACADACGLDRIEIDFAAARVSHYAPTGTGYALTGTAPFDARTGVIGSGGAAFGDRVIDRIRVENVKYLTTPILAARYASIVRTRDGLDLVATALPVDRPTTGTVDYVGTGIFDAFYVEGISEPDRWGPFEGSVVARADFERGRYIVRGTDMGAGPVDWFEVEGTGPAFGAQGPTPRTIRLGLPGRDGQTGPTVEDVMEGLDTSFARIGPDGEAAMGVVSLATSTASGYLALGGTYIADRR